MIQPVTDTLWQLQGYCGGLLLSASKRHWLWHYGSKAMMNRLLYLAIDTTSRATEGLSVIAGKAVLLYLSANNCNCGLWFLKMLIRVFFLLLEVHRYNLWHQHLRLSTFFTTYKLISLFQHHYWVFITCSWSKNIECNLHQTYNN